MNFRKPKFKTILICSLTAIYIILGYSKINSNKKIFDLNDKQSAFETYLDARCIRVIDGDTIEVQFLNKPESFNQIEKIRFIGVNTPELNIHKKEDKEYFAQEAFEFTRKELENKYIRLQFDNVSDVRDKYDRLLCYVWIDKFIFNKILIEGGYGKYYPNFKFNEERMVLFEKAEEYARINKMGMWNNVKQ